MSFTVFDHLRVLPDCCALARVRFDAGGGLDCFALSPCVVCWEKQGSARHREKRSDVHGICRSIIRRPTLHTRALSATTDDESSHSRRVRGTAGRSEARPVHAGLVVCLLVSICKCHARRCASHGVLLSPAAPIRSPITFVNSRLPAPADGWSFTT